MKNRKPLPPTYLFLSLLAIIALHFAFPLMKIASLPWNLLGIIPLFSGIILNLTADKAFKEKETTVKPFQESLALVTDGVFKISRHPMYLGMEFLLFGLVILLGSLSPLIVVISYPFLMDRVFISVEERMLEEKFGSDWQSYKKRTRKWI